jgi:hypothetical protein
MRYIRVVPRLRLAKDCRSQRTYAAARRQTLPPPKDVPMKPANGWLTEKDFGRSEGLILAHPSLLQS